MQRTNLRTLVLALGLPLATAAFASGCGEQGEGEVCDFKNNANEDCESGLQCIAGEQLGSPGIDRCCPPVGASSDERCIRGNVGTGGAGGASGAGGAGGSAGTGDAATDSSDASGGTAGTGGTDDGGNDVSVEACADPCARNSDCLDPTQVCGPQGCCQPECVGNRDCDDDEECVSGVCQPRPPEAGAG